MSDLIDLMDVTIDDRRFHLSVRHTEKLVWHCYAIEIRPDGEWLHWDSPICTHEPTRKDALSRAAEYLMRHALSEDGDIS